MTTCNIHGTRYNMFYVVPCMLYFKHSMWLIVLQRVTVQFILDVLYFPLWWYSAGALTAMRFCFQLFSDQQTKLAPMLWLKNLFVPMYGQYDWQGRIVSVFIRFANVCIRSLVVIVWAIFYLIGFVLYLLTPLVLIGFLFRSLFA